MYHVLFDCNPVFAMIDSQAAEEGVRRGACRSGTVCGGCTQQTQGMITLVT